MPSYKVPRIRPRYYVDESEMNKGTSQYMALKEEQSKPEPFVFRTREQVRRSSVTSQAGSDTNSTHEVVSP